MTTRVIVCGSRSWHERRTIADRLADLPADTVVVHGAARGADRIAHQEAQKLGLLVEAHPAEWDTHGKRAGFIRNEAMAELGAVLCIAFWDGRSNGTWDMMDRAEKHGIPVDVVPPRYDYVWFWRSKLGERKGQRCRVLARGALNSILVEFEDGYKTVTSRYAVRNAA